MQGAAAMGSSARRIHDKAPEIMRSWLKAQVKVLQQSTAECGTAQEHASKQILSISLAHESILMFLLLPHKCCVRPVLKLMHDVGRQHPRLRAYRKQTLHSTRTAARFAIS